MADKKYKPADLESVTRYSIKKRPHKTSIKSFAKPLKKSAAAKQFFKALPDFLKASDLNEYLNEIIKARRSNKPFHLMMGAHLIKVGLSPILIDLMKNKFVTGLSFNSAGIIHDLELAFWGGTSEDVQSGLDDGSFGMVEETGAMVGRLSDLIEKEKCGLGEAVGMLIAREKAPFRKYSLFYNANQLNLPVTVHISIGTDTIAQHPEFNAAVLSEASHKDFKLLASICSDINNGGVVANIGSAVILPEVFLKALTVARNLKKTKNKITTANFDMITHYRPMVNVINRPTKLAGKGFNFVGHHEIMIPLLAWGLKNA